MKTPIVIPLGPDGGYWKNNTEIRYAVRSIAQHFIAPYEIHIISKSVPKWLVNVNHIPCDGDLKAAIRAAAAEFPDGFFWWYDDIHLLQPQMPQDLMVTTANPVWSKPRTSWSKDLEKVRLRLVKEKLPCVDYSRPHGPYWFTKEMIDMAFKDWPGMLGRFPFESWVLNKFNRPWRTGVTAQYYGRVLVPPQPHHVILSYNDLGFTKPLHRWMDACWPECHHER